MPLMKIKFDHQAINLELLSGKGFQYILVSL